jgi:hypothetical protein
LHGLLAYALQASSLAQLAAWGVLSDTADITPSSWLKRLRASTAWLTWLLNCLLGCLPASWLTSFGRWRPLIIDLSDIGIVGGSGNDLRLHICYDLLAGQFAQLHLTERSHGEDLSIWKLKPRDILIVDAGYGYRSKIAGVVASLAQIVTRIYLPTCPLLDRQGKPLDLVRHLERRGQTPLEVPAQIEHDGKLIEVRVLAVALPADQRNRAQQRLCKKARRNGRTASPTGKLLAGWMVLLTTLPADPWTAEAIVALYRARWQVEIVIKRFKQLLHLPVLRCRSVTSGVPLLTLYLIGWALSSGLVAELRPALQAAAAPAPTTLPGHWPAADAVVSSWRLQQFSLDLLRQQVWGQWSAARLREVLPRLVRHLVSHPQRGREHQETVVRARLTGRRITPPRPHLEAI